MTTYHQTTNSPEFNNKTSSRRRLEPTYRHMCWLRIWAGTATATFGYSQAKILRRHLTRPRNQSSARAVQMSGVFTGAMGQDLASRLAVKIPDNRIELRSKRFPGTRDDGVLQRPEAPSVNTAQAHAYVGPGLRRDDGSIFYFNELREAIELGRATPSGITQP
jgi:hypothetical protein